MLIIPKNIGFSLFGFLDILITTFNCTSHCFSLQTVGLLVAYEWLLAFSSRALAARNDNSLGNYDHI